MGTTGNSSMGTNYKEKAFIVYIDTFYRPEVIITAEIFLIHTCTYCWMKIFKNLDAYGMAVFSLTYILSRQQKYKLKCFL